MGIRRTDLGSNLAITFEGLLIGSMPFGGLLQISPVAHMGAKKPHQCSWLSASICSYSVAMPPCAETTATS